MPDACIGNPCHQVSFKTSDLKPERWQVDGDQNPDNTQRVYNWPTPQDGYETVGSMPAMRAAFEAAGQAEMDKYQNPVPGQCSAPCQCALSTDPKDKTVVHSRVPVTASYTFPGGGTATIFGSFLLETTRINGLCTVGTPVGHVAPPEEGAWYYADYSDFALAAIIGKKAKPAKKR